MMNIATEIVRSMITRNNLNSLMMNTNTIMTVTFSMIKECFLTGC